MDTKHHSPLGGDFGGALKGRICPECGAAHHRERARLCGRCDYRKRRDVKLTTCRQDAKDVQWVEDALRRSPRWCRIVGRALADALGIEL